MSNEELDGARPINVSSSITEKEYNDISDDTMERLTESLEALQEELGESDFDVEYSVCEAEQRADLTS